MMIDLKRFAVVTSGGDAPGMNAAVRAVVRSAVAEKLEVIGFERGYAGLLSDQAVPLDARSVGGIIHQGGTFLKSSRAEAMKTSKGIRQAVNVLNKRSVNGLIVIGGNGSFMGAYKIHNASEIPVIGIPASIDNDLAGTDTTIGFDTAVNTALEAVDKIRDTATSHERVFVVEVMGRHRGFIALEVGISAGAEVILIPEIKHKVSEVCKRLIESYNRGKKSSIIVMAEGAGDHMKLAKSIRETTGFEVRLTSLGHVQRGGAPTSYSRYLASRMGNASIRFLLEGKKRDMTGIKCGVIVPVDLEYACTAEKELNKHLYDLALKLST